MPVPHQVFPRDPRTKVQYRAVRTSAPMGEATRSPVMSRDAALDLANHWSAQGYTAAVEKRWVEPGGGAKVVISHRTGPWPRR